MEVQQIGGNNYNWNFGYQYDGDGRMIQLNNPFSESTTWSYTVQNVATQSRLGSQTMANGVSAVDTYDPMDRLLSITNKTGSGTLSSFTGLKYDAASNLLNETASVANFSSYSGTVTNTYDGFDQLASSGSTKSVNPYSHSYVPDPAGNLPTVRSTSFTYNSRNQIKNSGYVFDNNGNPTTYNGTTATYDPESHLISFGSAFSAAYRADGRRAWKQGSTYTDYYIYDQWGNDVCELESDADYWGINTWGPNGLISEKDRLDEHVLHLR